MSEILYSLGRYGFDESASRMLYRLLERTRACERDEVFYGLLRVFVARGGKHPVELYEPLKPGYSDDLFRVLFFCSLDRSQGVEAMSEETVERKNEETQLRRGLERRNMVECGSMRGGGEYGGQAWLSMESRVLELQALLPGIAPSCTWITGRAGRLVGEDGTVYICDGRPRGGWIASSFRSKVDTWEVLALRLVGSNL